MILEKRLGRSGKTVCAIIHAVLTSVLRLHQTLYRKAVLVPEHCRHPYWKHFKYCLGALDGTHVKVRANIRDQPRFRNRKGEVSINILGVCNPDGQFVYCLVVWEGSAHDARVPRDALARSNGLKVPKGQYYLCDARYTNCEGFLAPFLGQRYHLKEWGQNIPNTPEEYFNMKHSFARNVIKIAFGLLKMRWFVLRNTTWFSPEVVGRVVHACCLLHNFIKQEARAIIAQARNSRILKQ
ncbi:Putative nuclease HARBI1 [Linum perenne]